MENYQSFVTALLVIMVFGIISYFYFFTNNKNIFGLTQSIEEEVATVQNLLLEYKQKLAQGDNANCDKQFPLLINYDFVLQDNALKIFANCLSNLGYSQSNLINEIKFSASYLPTNDLDNTQIQITINKNQKILQNTQSFFVKDYSLCHEYKINELGIIQLQKTFTSTCDND